MNVVSALVGVNGFQVTEEPHDLELFRDSIASVQVPGRRAISRALPQLLRLTIEIISGAIRPSSNKRPTRSDAWRPRAISVCISASFF